MGTLAVPRTADFVFLRILWHDCIEIYRCFVLQLTWLTGVRSRLYLDFALKFTKHLFTFRDPELCVVLSKSVM